MPEVDKKLFISSHSAGAKMTLSSRLDDNQYIIEEFLSNYGIDNIIDDHQDAKIDYDEVANAINEAIFILGGKYLSELKPRLAYVNEKFDAAFSFDDTGFGLQDIRYLNARGYVGLLLRDGSESQWFKKASVTLEREMNNLVEGRIAPALNEMYHPDLLGLWAAELLRCLLRREYSNVIERFGDIDNSLNISKKQTVESNLISFCNEIASKSYSKTTKFLTLLNDFWCECLSSKQYWGFPNYYIYLIRYIYVYEVLHLDPALDDIYVLGTV